MKFITNLFKMGDAKEALTQAKKSFQKSGAHLAEADNGVKELKKINNASLEVLGNIHPKKVPLTERIAQAKKDRENKTH